MPGWGVDGGQRVRVKICGIADLPGRDAAEAADWIGFVFFAGSPRAVTPARAASLAGTGGPARVGLFVQPEDAEVAAALAALPLDALQIYADPPRAAELRARFGVPVWQALAVETKADLPATAAADALLVEPRPPVGAGRPGGLGLRLDWSVTRGWQAPAPWLLAGGLTPGNVAEAVACSGARAVDVSSGVERERGVKDPMLVRAFIAAARAMGDAGRVPARPAAASA